jgi:hypothetical protein
VKKILIILAILVLSVGGFLLYKRWQAAKLLEEFSQGREYQGMGLTLEIFPGSAKVRGWWHPTLMLDRATVGLVSVQTVLPQSLTGARLEVNPFNPDTLRLVAPRITLENEEGSLDGVYFVLKKDKTIPEVGIQEAQVKEKKFAGEVTDIQRIRFEVGPWVGFIPDRATWGVEKVELKKDGSTIALLGPIQASLTSQKNGTSRQWQLAFNGQGGTLQPGAENHWTTGSVKPWRFSMDGSAQEVSKDNLFTFMKDFSSRVKELKKPAAESAPSESMPGAPDISKFSKPYEDLVNFLISLGIQPGTTQINWEGLSFQSKDGWEVEVKPSGGHGDMTYQADSFSGNTTWNLESLHIKTNTNRYDLKGLALSYKGEYHLGYNRWFQNLFTYYKRLFTDVLQNPTHYNPYANLATAYAHYPDEAVYELKAASFSYVVPETSGDHHDLSLGFKIEPKGFGYSVHDAFEQNFTKDPSLDIKDGSLNLSLDNLVPWEKYLKAARASLSEKTPGLNLPEVFQGERGGIHWTITAEGGPNWFGTKLNLEIQDELGKYFQIWQTSMTPGPGQSFSQMKEIFAMNALKEFLARGFVDFSLEIQPYSRFQAVLDKIKPGTSMELGVAGPYMVVDTKADSLSVKLGLKDGKVLLNGQEAPDLNHAMQSFLQKTTP